MANFPLINEASLVMASGAYKEGKIYSQLPTDGSGDFTFTRGTDTATRVNKDGYIEKEYVNLFLYSNDFQAGSPYWRFYGAGTVTPNQEGYDGTNNASLIDATSFLRYTIAPSVGHTVSVYAKAGSVNWIRIVGDYFDLYNGEAPNGGFIEPVGNGWYRCSTLITTTGTDLRIYPAAGNGSNTSGSFYLQDSQLNPGLVAYPYIETTTAPVYAGLTDNMPRLDYSGGAECGAYLLEPSRTNLMPYSEYFGVWTNYNSTESITNETSPEGRKNVYEIIEDTANGPHIIRYSYLFQSGQEYTISAFLKENTRSKVVLAIGGSTLGGMSFEERSSAFDLSSGIIDREPTGGFSTIKDYGNGWYRCSVTITPLSTSNANLDIYLVNDNDETSYVGDGASGFYVYGAQLEEGSYPTSYIPTYGSFQTRAADVPTVSKTLPSEGSLFINVGGTSQPKLSVLGEYFDASTTANKVAIAYSPTALVISHNGSIVVDKTGTYDVSSLTQIQLGHSNGSDQADSPISEFVTFDSFLTNNELNALTQ